MRKNAPLKPLARVLNMKPVACAASAGFCIDSASFCGNLVGLALVAPDARESLAKIGVDAYSYNERRSRIDSCRLPA